MAHIDAFQVLADPSRRRLIEVLRGGELPVNDLVARSAIHQSGVSRHLRLLHRAGFVAVRPDGPRRLYSLRPERFRELDAWIDGYRQLWLGRLERFEQVLAARTAGAPRQRRRS